MARGFRVKKRHDEIHLYCPHFFLALASVAQAEDPKMGLLRGTVIDDDFGDPVMYAEVRVEGLDVSTLTDLDGQYSFELAPGTYTLSVEFLGYAKQVVNEVVVKEGVPN